MSAPRLAPGQVVAGKYSIRAMLGYGGATATYTAVLAPGRDVVVKLFSPQIAQRSDVLGALQQVAAVVSGLGDATNPILESGFDPQTGAPFMVTDLATIPSLAQAAERGPLPPADVVLLLRGMARAVDGAHAQRLAHGALKPQNVFVGAAPQRPVRVLDFGVAVVRAALPTNEGYAVAAPWMAPEQMQGAPGGAAADVFSAALVAFFAATGRSYWRSCQGAAPDLAALQQEMAAPRAPPSARAREIGGALTPAFDGALVRALSLSPSERFASLGELADTMAKAGGAAPQKMAMTMPLNAMPQAAQDLLRAQTAAAVAGAPTVASPAAAYSGATTLAVSSPAEAAWAAAQQGAVQQAAPMQQPQVPQQQAMQPMQPMQGMQGPGQPGSAAMLPTPYGGFQASGSPSMQPMQAGAQPGYSMRPPESSVVLPKSRTGLFILLALVGLAVIGGLVAVVLLVPRRGGVASNTDTKPESTQAAAPPGSTPASTPPASATAAAAAPPVETQDAAAAAPGPGDGAAPQSAEPDGAAAALAELTIVCVPDCDSVKIDDKALDATDAGLVAPEPMQVAVGPHTVAVGKATYMAQTKKISLKAGQKAKETFYMTKPGAIAIPRPCGKFLERCPN